MKKLTHSLCIVTGVLALAAGACSSSGGKPNPGTDGGGSGSLPAGWQLINITSSGYAMDTMATGSAMPTGIIGALYVYGDSIGPNAQGTTDGDIKDSDCVAKGKFPASACSVVSSPMAGAPFSADPTTGAFCTSGTATQVMNADYSDLWGAGMGLDLNNPGGDAGTKGVWDGSKFTGMAFHIEPGPGATTIPATYMRVNFPFTGEHGTDSPFYQGALKSNSGLPAKGGDVEMRWAEIGGPSYLSSQTPPVDVTKYPFDKTMIQSIQWQVFTNATSATPYSFCISNLSVLTD